MSSTDKPGTGTVDNQSPTQTRPPERPPPRQPEDPRSRTQYNNDTYAKPPVQRRHDNASSSSAQRPDGASRSSDSTSTGKDTNTKPAPAANDRTTQRSPERSTAADASTPARQQTPKDTRTTAEYNRDTHAGPPVHRYKDSNPGTRPEGNSRAPAGAQTADQPAARDTTAPRTARNTERAGPTPTDNHGPAGRQTPADPRSTAEYTRDKLIGPPVHRHDDNTERSPDPTASASGRPSPEAHSEPHSRASAPEQPGTAPDASAQRAETETASREPRDNSTPDTTARLPEPDRNVRSPTADGTPAAEVRDHGQITHYHSDFKGQSLDLYSDGTRWASEDRPSETNGPDESDEYKNRYDSPPADEDLVDAAGEDSSRLEKLRRELYEESEDELDVIEKDTNTVHDIFSRPPAGGHAETPAHQPYIGAPQHAGLDAGSMATSAFVTGLILDRAARWAVHRYQEHLKR